MSNDLPKKEMRESPVCCLLKRKISCVVLLLFVFLSVKCTFENNEEKMERELFDQSLNGINAKGVESITLSEITQFEWETVCNVHPYGGDLYVKQYDRTYVGPMSEAHDGTWVLAFIAHDGTPKYMWPEKIGVKIHGGLKRCYSKEKAKLKKFKPYGNRPQYQLYEESQE